METLKKSKLRIVVPALIVTAATAAVVGIYMMPAKAKLTPPGTRPTVNVEVVVVKPEPEVVDRFELPAVVEANRIVTVAAEVAGRVERIIPAEGTACSEGDTLLELNSDLLKADFDSVCAQEKNSSLRYSSICNLHRDGATTDRERDQAEAELAMCKAAKDAAYARLIRAKVIAPISGVLNDMIVEKGEYVQPGMPVAQIVDIATAKVVVQVPERDVQFIGRGDTVRILASVRGVDTELHGNITYICELAHSATRTTRVEVSVDNSQRILRSGHIVRVVLTRSVLSDVVMVPLAAVIPQENTKGVYVVKDGKAEHRDVKLGIIKGNNVQILSGLAPEDHLIVAGHRFVASGSPVSVKTRSGDTQ